MSRKIHVVHAKPGEPAEVLEIDSTLASFQRLVGGGIEGVSCPWAGLGVYVNLTGRLDNLPFNQVLGPHHIYGAFVVFAVDADGEPAEMTHEDVARVVLDLNRQRVLDEDQDAKAERARDKKNAPTIIGRSLETDAYGARTGDWFDERASTRHVHTARDDFWGSNEGSVEVSIFESEDDEDRGGVVLRFESDTIEDFIPFAKMTPRGVELHFGGQWEAEAHLRALAEVLQKRPPKEAPDGPEDPDAQD